MSKRRILVPALLAAGALLTGPVSPAQAADDVYLAAGLRGASEVGAPGDADGASTVVLKVSGNQVTFAARWNGIGVPTAGRVHAGAKGTEGDVRLDLLPGSLPASALGVTGTVTASADVVDALVENPGGFYANLSDAAHPKGAVRGQFHRLSRPIDLNGVLHGGDQATISASTGTQAGGRATWWLRPGGSSIAYTVTWSGLGRVTAGHLHKGAPGRHGAVAAELFTVPRGLPANVTGVTGETPVAPKVAKHLAAGPGGYHADLRTAESGDGRAAARLSGAAFTHPRGFTAEVLRGSQIYACTELPAGGYGFTQLGVTATLKRGIEHTFVTPASGPPQWVAPDGSAVRGAVFSRTPNGAHIPELVLDATQAGAGAGLLAQATQILRLNTTGGVAPAGACEPGAEVSVPYGADYVFLG
ncbi:CHRD domain-containing protein [Nonomuraea fuscirosea]|uniref:CHRD domain-containing protein n=1 Tax=Nonomuraea fuscirosea TaxID=1291556 RepID=A0A2T0NB31_9ACTN|nr:CHRD domain-containing protein [Nonomuraea fuscirosea]PRX70221.1 CHRD domain-containing protein [Nonomuraea fuscirosea]